MMAAAATDRRPAARPRARSTTVTRVSLRLLIASAVLWTGCGHGGAARPRPRCPVAGPVTLYGQDDVALVAGCARLPGLTVRTAAPIDLAPLTALVAIDGDLIIGPTLGITTLALPAVASIAGRLRVAGNGDLTGLFLPALRAAGAVEIVDDPALVSVSSPALTTIAGPLTLARLPALELIDTHALTAVAGPVAVTAVPALTTWLTADGAAIDPRPAPSPPSPPSPGG